MPPPTTTRRTATARHRTTPAVSRTVKSLARDGGSTYLGGNVSPGANYTYVMQPYSAMPSGAAFSTATAFDALQWGLQLTSTSTTARLTQVAVVVVLDR